MPLIYALDFDGVLCDSVHESSRTALLSAKAQWPHLPLPATPTSPFPEPLIAALRAVRPAIETGYENVLLGRLVAETPLPDLEADFVAPVLSDWATMKDDLMARWDVPREQLVHTFGTTRDSWIQDDPDAWVTANQFFPGVIDALNFASVPVYIITTKQRRFAHLLLSSFGANVPEENIYGLGMGTKIEVLKQLIARHPGCDVVFVEDRYETLEKVSLSMLGQPLQLYLADWGYNTPDVRKVAAKHPFITLLDLASFANKFQLSPVLQLLVWYFPPPPCEFTVQRTQLREMLTPYTRHTRHAARSGVSSACADHVETAVVKQDVATSFDGVDMDDDADSDSLSP